MKFFHFFILMCLTPWAVREPGQKKTKGQTGQRAVFLMALLRVGRYLLENK